MCVLCVRIARGHYEQMLAYLPIAYILIFKCHHAIHSGEKDSRSHLHLCYYTHALLHRPWVVMDSHVLMCSLHTLAFILYICPSYRHTETHKNVGEHEVFACYWQTMFLCLTWGLMRIKFPLCLCVWQNSLIYIARIHVYR